MKESILYFSFRCIAALVQRIPLRVALKVGGLIGLFMYFCDMKRKTQVYANLKKAFAREKSLNELKCITKETFKNYGKCIIELMRMPCLTSEKFNNLVDIEGRCHVDAALEKGNGAILLAMHYGSWELASVACAMMDVPYKVFVNSQEKYYKLGQLLNSYRSCGNSVILTRGAGTREFIKSLRNNEVVGMVADQGGRDGMVIPFFGKGASLSVGAIRMGLKMGVPICFSIIQRKAGGKHKLTIHEPLKLVQTGNVAEDIETNLSQIVKMMEGYISEQPAEYMWFYKIWKYTKEANICILSDRKKGHQNQSESVAQSLTKALSERGITATTQTINIHYLSKIKGKFLSILSACLPCWVYQGRLSFLKNFIKHKTFRALNFAKPDYIISCGSSIAGMNHLIARDNLAKSIVVLKPGLLKYKKFDLVLLPQHDRPHDIYDRTRVKITTASPNLISKEYLTEQKHLLLTRFPHLKKRHRYNIAVMIGGDAKNVHISDRQIRTLIHQLREVAKSMKADLLITTSRRTPKSIERLLFKRLKKHPHCPLLLQPSHGDVPEAVGGILGLADLVIVSGDSLSMVSEAAASGKNTIVFMPQTKEILLKEYNKHRAFIDRLNTQGFILSTHVKNIGCLVFDVTKHKVSTKKLDDNDVILAAVRGVI